MENPCANAIKGFEDVKPMVFSGIYPVDTEDYEELRYSMEKLQLNDSSLVFSRNGNELQETERRGWVQLRATNELENFVR